MIADHAVKLPPQSLDAEKSLIASMLLDATVLDETSIRPEQFHSDAMARIFQAMQRMRRVGTPIDSVTLAEELIAAGQLESVGGLAVLGELMDVVSHSAHAGYYASMITEKWMRREIIHAARSVESECFESGRTSDEILATAVQRLSQLDDGSDRDGLVTLGESCQQVLDAIMKRQNGDDQTGRLSTGFADLDSMLGGFGEGQMIVLASRPAMGKTALAYNMAANAMKAGSGVFRLAGDVSLRAH